MRKCLLALHGNERAVPLMHWNAIDNYIARGCSELRGEISNAFSPVVESTGHEYDVVSFQVG